MTPFEIVAGAAGEGSAARLAIEVVLALLLLVTVLVALARRARVADPILLVVAGAVVGFVPGLPRLQLEPDLVFVLFLPPILYAAGYLSSVRDFRANLRPILLLSVGLVVFTAVVLAIVVRVLVPDLPWAVAFAFGAIVAPPDAVAATAVFRRLGVPRRVVTILEGESLLNDATALVALRTAIVAIGASVSLVDATVDFAVVASGGIVVGLVLGWIVGRILQRIDDPVLGIFFTLLVPTAVYLPAEELGFSGVLSVVVAGLMAGRKATRDLNSAQRVQGSAAWEVVLFLINGLVFILIGLQLQGVLAAVGAERDALELVGLAVAVSLAAILARFAWVFPGTYVPRWLSAGIRAREPEIQARNVTVVAWAGMRGVVSLAAALALPADVPGRDLILFLTFAVIFSTLVVQGLTLPLLIRALHVTEDSGAAAEELVARREAVDAALERLDGLADEWPDHRELVDQLRDRYNHRVAHLEPAVGPVDEAEREVLEHGQIRRGVTDAERAAVIRLRDQGAISDEVLRTIVRELDLEELRMEG